MNCPHCQTQLPENHAGETCPACGAMVAKQSKPPDTTVRDKTVYRVVFWLAFLGSPTLCLLLLSQRAGGGILFILILGAIVAGFSLAKVYAKSAAALISTGILISFGVVIVYVGILFVGCLYAVGHGGGH
jgi:hypothetical protein